MAGASGNSTFYTENIGFEDNFTPVVPETQTEKQVKPMSTLTASPKPTKKNSRPSTPVHTAQKSPLNCYVLRLKHNEELRKALLNFVEQNGLKAAFVLSCVGSALSAKLRPASAVASTEGNYMLDLNTGQEIVSLQGTLSGGGHLHAALADVTGKVTGGHLLELIVDTTAEVVIGECAALTFSRHYDQNTGFTELSVDSR